MTGDPLSVRLALATPSRARSPPTGSPPWTVSNTCTGSATPSSATRCARRWNASPRTTAGRSRPRRPLACSHSHRRSWRRSPPHRSPPHRSRRCDSQSRSPRRSHPRPSPPPPEPAVVVEPPGPTIEPTRVEAVPLRRLAWLRRRRVIVPAALGRRDRHHRDSGRPHQGRRLERRRHRQLGGSKCGRPVDRDRPGDQPRRPPAVRDQRRRPRGRRYGDDDGDEECDHHRIRDPRHRGPPGRPAPARYSCQSGRARRGGHVHRSGRRRPDRRGAASRGRGQPGPPPLVRRQLRRQHGDGGRRGHERGRRTSRSLSRIRSTSR